MKGNWKKKFDNGWEEGWDIIIYLILFLIYVIDWALWTKVFRLNG